jgi:hypothetical protein
MKKEAKFSLVLVIKSYVEVEVQIHAFLTLVPDEGDF